jgi:hypothetical protein
LGGVSHLGGPARYPIDREIEAKCGAALGCAFFLCPEWPDPTMKNSISAEAGVLAGLTGLAEDGDRFTRRMTSKRIGEVSEAALALKARTMGFMVAKPWGDSELYDLILGLGEAPVAGATEVHAGDPFTGVRDSAHP